ncbi:MAG: hypothetical protein CVU39_17115 [Chloroflexi bacterium HGW-Chloroflexi-10]|nr:MAG: hypothetical protein CVU39_17115 [Chloroflexi bacterium HGW-Chloroflexi-10]
MLVKDAQKEMRMIYKGGFVGQLVSGILWLISAALGTFVSQRLGIASLIVGGMFIFPLTQLGLKLAGQPATLSSGNPLQSLAKQVAFIVPICIPVIAGAALYNVNWYYPAFMIIVGAHYLPFMFMYGIWQYVILAGLLILGGFGLGYFLPISFSLGGWFTGIVLVGFAVALRMIFSKETKSN